MTWTPARVREQSIRWTSSWHPVGSQYMQFDSHELYLLDGVATLLNYRGELHDPVRVLAEAGELARGLGLAHLRFTRAPGLFGSLDDAWFASRNATTIAVRDILALKTAPQIVESIAVPTDVRAHRVDDDAGIAEFSRISLQAWGFPPPILDEPTEPGAQPPGLFVAEVADGGAYTAAGAGGYVSVDDVARMWGGAVLPEYQRRGVYRALIVARLRDAHSRGASLALVHAEAATSSPILQRMGFRKFGERAIVNLPLE